MNMVSTKPVLADATVDQLQAKIHAKNQQIAALTPAPQPPIAPTTALSEREQSIRQKIAGGLTRCQAEQVLDGQAAHDSVRRVLPRTPKVTVLHTTQ
jgi:hypothetical protein